MGRNQQDLLQQDCERVFQGINDPDSFAILDGMAILITGGTGFIGAWLGQFISYVKKTLKINIKVYIVGRDKQKFDQRFGYYENGVEFIRCDVRHLTEIPRDVNFIVHAAGIPDTRFHMSNPMETMTTISDGTINVLKAADRASNIRMILHLSSGSVYCRYPAEDMVKISEGQTPGSAGLDSIRSAYVEAKRYAEVLCAAGRSEMRLPICIIRPFSFIGPYQSLDAPWAINNFINDGLSKRPIRILGDGQAVRGFLYGADAAGWLLKLLTCAKSDQVYNIGSPDGFSLEEIARKVAVNFNPSPEILLNASLIPIQSTITRFLPDISKICSTCNVRQYTSLDMAIKRTIEWNADIHFGGGK
ncbi:MAG TPA: NAD(P)-dependent oxidoreductase [Chitinispirillaceae bacterium]|nr:NAD(P)-dependent oxidoreductase [Chitinispirillaceae bacterium]